MIKAGAVLVEPVTRGPGVGMQAEQLPAAEREHGVVKGPGLLVLIQDRPAAQQLAVPAGASLKVSHGHSDMGDRRELRHGGLLTGGGRETGYPDLARALSRGASSVQMLMLPPLRLAPVSKLADLGRARDAARPGPVREPGDRGPARTGPHRHVSRSGERAG
jgi:hypothetical protein